MTNIFTKHCFLIKSRRGSFLSRGEKLLSKLAELTNVSSDNPLGNMRGQRNMVFAVVSPPKEESKEMVILTHHIYKILYYNYTFYYISYQLMEVY